MDNAIKFGPITLVEEIIISLSLGERSSGVIANAIVLNIFSAK
jgi:hypothetical protein